MDRVPARHVGKWERWNAWFRMWTVALLCACSSPHATSPAQESPTDVVDAAVGLDDVSGGTDTEAADVELDDATPDADAVDVVPDVPVDVSLPSDATGTGWSPKCFACHGTKGTDNPAPPHGTDGETATTEAAVGAHQQHLGLTDWHRRVTCQDCHVVPDHTPHANGVIDFQWSGPAIAGGAQPTFDPTSLTCATVACHGSQLFGPPAGATVLRQPIWTQVDGTLKQCGLACHNTPPGPPHAGNLACQQCHGAVIASFDPLTQHATWVDASRHIDGVVDGPALTCTACHGQVQTGDPAPPQGSRGEVATTFPAVGAHQAHLKSADWHQQVACGACHAVPTQALHADGVANVDLSGLALADGATATWDPPTLHCDGVYCHGATLAGPKTGVSLTKQPVWNQVDGTFNQCGKACHTTPPGGDHPTGTACQLCHGAVIASFDLATQKAVWANGAAHINGQVEVAALTCTSCHGNPATQSPAPPNGTHGETATTDAAVGAHASHLAGADWHRQVQCGDCHVVPTDVTHTNGVVDWQWSGPAVTATTAPTWDPTTLSCQTVACHGATLPNAATPTATTPVWTQVDGSFKSCGQACHQTPPGGTHPKSTACQLCHGAVIQSFDPATQLATWTQSAKHIDGVVDVAVLTCTSCHGDAATQNPAPPTGTHGETATTDPGVGAHQAHLSGGAWHRPVQCVDCHLVPTSMTHTDGVTELAWSSVAAGTGTPTLSPAAQTCSNVACHGDTAAMASNNPAAKHQPVWTQVDGGFATCGQACHQTPPAGNHPQSQACELCHGAVIQHWDAATQTATWQDSARHVDGVVDVSTLTCTTCHGDAATQSPAPPHGTHGETATTDPAVGAHASHLGAATWHRQVQCADCHLVPTSMTHTDGTVAVDLAGPATAGGADAAFVPASLTCNAVWCHGAQLPASAALGPVLQVPLWTKVDGTFKSCGQACHGAPPGPPHPQNTACASCHGAVIASFDPVSQTATWTDATRHIDGVIDAPALTCTACHGDGQNPAPPTGSHGETATTSPAVGAHAAHLGTTTWHRQVQCADCHAVPSDPLHADGTAQVTFGVVPHTDGASPTFSPATATCSSVYCHGTTLPTASTGDALTQPVWTAVDGSFKSCGQACHQTPPGGDHPKSTACALCHGDVIAGFDPVKQTAVWQNASRHIDGHVDVLALTCTSCHGNASTQNPAPPTGTHGETSTTAPAVGAHAQHLGPASWHRQVQCTDCHIVPAVMTHADGEVGLAWSGPAAAGGASPTFEPATLTCAATWCHGAAMSPPATGPAPATVPKWTQVDGSFKSCGQACHQTPPPPPHTAKTDCQTCHGDVIAAFDPATGTAEWKDATRHIDGVIDAGGLSCTSCHGDAATQNPAPPTGTHGETATSTRAVGAHAQHLGAATWHRQVQCTDCHVVPVSPTHASGVVEMAWSAVALAANATPTWDASALTCATVYCHGTTLGADKQGAQSVRTPQWTQVDGTFKSCGQACHTTPPGGAHPTSTECQLCHADVIAAFDPVTQQAGWHDAARHINGVVDVASLTCTSCHGNAATQNPAPPQGTHGETSTGELAVGAHTQHLTASTWHRQVACTDCHAVPNSTTHADGVVAFVWSAVAMAADASPVFDVTSASCATVYCHGSTLAADKPGSTSQRTPIWTQVNGTFNACGQACHTTPPGGSHPTSTACAMCHGEVIASFDVGTQAATWTDAQRHMDGKVDVAALTCTSCHGDQATNNPAPPRGTHGEVSTSAPAVGAHAAHLGESAWHREVACADCHVVPASVTHADGMVAVDLAGPATAGGAQPAFDPQTLGCAATWCHGSQFPVPPSGPQVLTTPTWTAVDGSFKSCGQACHQTPPGPPHTPNTACQTCHGGVIASFDPATQTATWVDPARHIDGVVDAPPLSCTACHGDAATQNPAPPSGPAGETQTSQAAVGAHAAHLGASLWHRQVQCADCHLVPAQPLHADGVPNVDFSGPAIAHGAGADFDPQQLSCASVWCHGGAMTQPGNAGALATQPVWTQVDGTFNACGQACHSTPPGGTHPTSQTCSLCHGGVIAQFQPQTGTATWVNPALHVNGTVDVAPYHTLPGWTSPKFDAGGAVNPQHHGVAWYLANHGTDDKGAACSSCHGAALDGGPVAVSCNNATIACHGAHAATNASNGDWRACTFCHGDATHENPPAGVWNEAGTGTLAVGAHTMHLTSTLTHVALTCDRCHTVPATGDVAHTQQYGVSTDLATSGHHGDVTLPAPPAVAWNTGTMLWNVGNTLGTPVTARGTCAGACHSDGRGGAPVVMPYWAGGTWTDGSCNSCHLAVMTSARHTVHTSVDNKNACTVCHPAASSPSHVNGIRDVFATIVPTTGTGSITNTRPTTGSCANRVQCTGTCHGQDHAQECWK